MAVTIAQKPLYDVLPIGQQVIFAISEDTIVATKFKVKFVAEIHVSNTTINLSNNDDLIGTFKTTPNNAGVGIFDLRPILETFVSPDNLGSTIGNGSRYKLSADTHPIHLIDKYALSKNSIKHFAIKFKVEYAESATDSVLEPSNATTSLPYLMFNGVLQYDDVLTLENGEYGYNLDSFYLDDVNAKFLTNMQGLQTMVLCHFLISCLLVLLTEYIVYALGIIIVEDFYLKKMLIQGGLMGGPLIYQVQL